MFLTQTSGEYDRLICQLGALVRCTSGLCAPSRRHLDRGNVHLSIIGLISFSTVDLFRFVYDFWVLSGLCSRWLRTTMECLSL